MTKYDDAFWREFVRQAESNSELDGEEARCAWREHRERGPYTDELEEPEDWASPDPSHPEYDPEAGAWNAYDATCRDSTEEFEEGSIDNAETKKRHECPYPPKTWRRRAWMEGWDAENQIREALGDRLTPGEE